MSESRKEPGSVRFGPFQTYPASQELRKNGLRLKLSGQAIQVLFTLLEAEGKIVKREELQRKLWPQASYGDFEHGLNAAVNRLREVLGDSAIDPAYIETVPRQGYRFIAPIEGLAEPTSPVDQGDAASKTKRLGKIGIVVGVLIIALCVVLFFLPSNQKRSQVNIVQFTSLPGFEDAPSFSPDGSQIVFAASSESHGPDLYIKAIGDEKVLQLTQPPGISMCPKWSPDGKTIVYYHRTGKNSQLETSIFSITPLGGAKREIRQIAQSSGCETSWSPDSDLLAYDDKPQGEKSGIFITSLTSDSVSRLTAAPDGMFDTSPAFSRDGQQVSFVRNTDDGGSPAIYLVSASGGEPKLVTSLRGIGRLAWTGDGKRIIFSGMGFFPGENSLFSVPAAGGQPERLQFISSDASEPAVSYRGDKLAYSTGFLDANIWKIPIDDANNPPARVVASSRLDNQPNLSPDGSKLAFVSNRDGPIAVWVSNADGTEAVRLCRTRGATPEWSPDGKHIVFDSNEGGHWFIVIVGTDGTAEMHLEDAGFDRRGPSWSADGKWVYFSSNRTGAWETWKASFPANEAVQITHNGGGYAQESRDGKFVYYQKEKTKNRHDFELLPQLWRMPTDGGREEMVISLNSSSTTADLSWFWRVTSEGIYFVDNGGTPLPLLRLYDFRGGKVRTLHTLEKRAWGGPGLTVSPDRKSVLLGQVDNAGSDIMLVENFH